MKRIFLDTNAVVDILLEREPWFTQLQDILNLYVSSLVDVISCSSMTIGTVYYLMERVRMPHNVVIEKIRRFRRCCNISSVDEAMVDSALHSSFKDLEDAMQYYSALSEGCDVIITRNKKDFVESTIPVMEPQEFLDEFYSK